MQVHTQHHYIDLSEAAAAAIKTYTIKLPLNCVGIVGTFISDEVPASACTGDLGVDENGTFRSVGTQLFSQAGAALSTFAQEVKGETHLQIVLQAHGSNATIFELVLNYQMVT